jgi:hypothetical protein
VGLGVVGAGLGFAIVPDGLLAGQEIVQRQPTACWVEAVVLRLPNRLLHDGAGVPAVRRGRAVGVLLVGPVDVGLVDGLAGGGVDEDGVLDDDGAR